MGNEFGHPEWIDFPREGNGWSHFYCRRQWSLADSPFLKYSYLNEFDRAMLTLINEGDLLKKAPRSLYIDKEKQVLVYERGGYIFAFNFSPTNAYEGYRIPVVTRGKYKAVLSTDEIEFGGYGRISTDYVYTATAKKGEQPYFLIYLPARTAVCLGKVK
jgi:1,4-alpha-glucan branching enzyme